MSDTAPEAGVREPLPDETLLVFVSDAHIGGTAGTDIFESAEELTALLEELGRHEGPVELVLAGDFIDLQRMEDHDAGEDRIASTIARPEYRELFATLRAFAQAPGHRVTYVVGNHDAEVWWNPRIQRSLEEAGLVHEFALSFASDPDQLIYCEHGNQLDPANRITDYANPLDTPVGAHIVIAVFVPVFVHTHVQVVASQGDLTVELFDHAKPVGRQVRWIDPFRIVPKNPKPADRRLQWIERVAVAGRIPSQPPPSAAPRLVSRYLVTRA